MGIRAVDGLLFPQYRLSTICLFRKFDFSQTNSRKIFDTRRGHPQLSETRLQKFVSFSECLNQLMKFDEFR